MTNEEKEEGIVVKSHEFKENERIISVFTLRLGIISLIVKGMSHTKPSLTQLTTPFCHAEYLYRKGKSQLFRFIEGSPINFHLSLRQSFSLLSTGGKMARAISSSQLPGKPAPHLYALFLAYLKKLPQVENPYNLLSSFYLKLLNHEGLLSLKSQCSRCQNTGTSLFEGETFCRKCQPYASQTFSLEDWQTLLQFLTTRQFKSLDQIHPAPSLHLSIENLFQKSLFT